MVKARADILIQKPLDLVYDFVVRDFFVNYPRWSPEVRRLDVLTPGPVRVGSRAHQVRIDQGRQSESTFRVTALEELTRLEADPDRYTRRRRAGGAQHQGVGGA